MASYNLLKVAISPKNIELWQVITLAYEYHYCQATIASSLSNFPTKTVFPLSFSMGAWLYLRGMNGQKHTFRLVSEKISIFL